MIKISKYNYMTSSSNSSGCGEVEAAEVLVGLGLGRSNSVDSGGGSGSGWGSKGRRSYNKRFRDGCDIGGGGTAVNNNSLPLPFDLNMDQTTLSEDECENDEQQNIDVKAENYEPTQNDGSIGVAHTLHNGGRSKHDLSEVEKEARKLRRILANRESARQTIRRRQALYEELKKRSSELTSENEDLKRTKNLAVQEFQSLQTTNHKLKNTISQIAGLELGKNPEAEVANTGSSSVHQPKWHQFLLYSSEMTMQPHIDSCRLIEHENNERSTSQQIPWCILQYPWFLSVPDTSKNVQLDDVRHICSPSSVIPRLRGCPASSDARMAFRADGASMCSSSNRFGPKQVASPLDGGVTLELKQRGFEPIRKKRDAVEAFAEARKRRREVMKLKSLHYDSASRQRYG